MRHIIRYADGHAVFDTEAPCTVAEARIGDFQLTPGILEYALSHPLNSQCFEEFAGSANRLLFILCDGTRPTPTARVLEHFHPHISRHPDVRFIIATGTHRPPTEAEFRRIFGKFHDEFMPRTLVHDSRNSDELMFLGKTSRGTPVSLSRHVMEADGIVTINSVEPHYFAGYTGGRKSFLPGVAAFESIERNHSHAAEPGAMPLVLEGNPVSEDMFEAFSLLPEKRIFSVQAVMTPHDSIYAAFAGGMNESFFSAVRRADEICSVEIPAKANIVVTASLPPMDCDLYQSQKALEHGRMALENGGIIILVSACRDGIGDNGFYNLLRDLKPGDCIADFMGPNYSFGNHKAARLLDLLERAEVWAVSELDREALAIARMVKFDTLQGAVEAAVQKMRQAGREPSILVIPSGSLTVPRVVV